MERGKKRKKERRRKKVCALAATVAKNTLPISSAQLPFSRWSVWFFLEFSVISLALFFHLISYQQSFHLMIMGTNCEFLLTC